MSGPIVRKYGFPNFENIFGKRELEHGVDENEAPPAETPVGDDAPTEASAPKGKAKAPKKKK